MRPAGRAGLVPIAHGPRAMHSRSAVRCMARPHPESAPSHVILLQFAVPVNVTISIRSRVGSAFCPGFGPEDQILLIIPLQFLHIPRTVCSHVEERNSPDPTSCRRSTSPCRRRSHPADCDAPWTGDSGTPSPNDPHRPSGGGRSVARRTRPTADFRTDRRPLRRTVPRVHPACCVLPAAPFVRRPVPPTSFFLRSNPPAPWCNGTTVCVPHSHEPARLPSASPLSSSDSWQPGFRPPPLPRGWSRER